MKIKFLRFKLPLVVFLVLTPFFSAGAASPEGRFGWWTPVSEIVSDDASCGAGYIKHELVIREIGTGNPVSVGSAIFVAGNMSNNAITSQISGAGPTVGTICFNPDNQFLALDIDGGAGYYDFYGSIAYGNAGIVPREKFMRTTVWVTPTSVNTFDYVQDSPVNTILNTSPTYKLNLNSFPTTYEASGVSGGILFVYNWNTQTKVAQTSTTLSGGTGIKTFPAQTLPDGLYVWQFYLALNANHDTGGLIALNVLKSGMGSYTYPFILDTTAPTFGTSLGHTPENPTQSDTVTITRSASDSLAGITSMKLYVNSVLVQTCPFVNVNSADCVVAQGPFGANTTHTYYVVATDAAGNTATSSIKSFSIIGLPNLTTPTHSAITNTGATLGATLLNNNGSAITSRGTCWGTTTDPVTNCSAEGGTAIETFNHVRTGMTSGMTVYYRGYAANAAGTGYSSSASFTTIATILAIPTDLTATQALCGTGQINLSWTAASGATSYDIERDSLLLNVGNITANNHTGLAASSAHAYRVRAVNGGGSSAWSAIVNQTAPATCAPLPDLTATNTFPVTNTRYYVPDFNPGSVSFSGTANNNNVTTIKQGGWADVEIDWNSDGSYTNYNAYNGLQLGAFAVNESKSIWYTYNAAPLGTHRYRFHADTDGSGVSESNETNNQSPWSTFVVSNAPPDLISQNLAVSAGPHTQGTPISLSAEVKNIGIETTFPWGFSDEFYYQWNGTSGAWTSFIGLAKGSLGIGETDSDEGVDFTPSQEGTLYIQHCVDSTNIIPEGANETPNCTVTSVLVGGGMSDCDGGIIQNCSVPTLGNGNQGGSCQNGYSGNCSYTCNNGTFQQNSNSCSAPNISYFGICLQSEPTNCTTAFGTLIVPVNTPLTASWTAAADTCSPITGPGFAIPDSTNSGNANFLADSAPSVSHRYQIGCKYGTGAPVVSWVDVVTAQQLPTLTANLTTVLQGNTVTISWDTNNGDETSCTLVGGSLSSNTVLSNGSGTGETGSHSILIEGRTTFVLTCGALSAVKTIEIIPSGWEA